MPPPNKGNAKFCNLFRTSALYIYQRLRVNDGGGFTTIMGEAEHFEVASAVIVGLELPGDEAGLVERAKTQPEAFGRLYEACVPRSEFKRTVQTLRQRTKGDTMKWLLWKEYRQNRAIVFAMLLFLFMLYLGGIFAVWRWASTEPPLALEYANIIPAGMFSVAFSQLGIALIGVNVIAAERVDRPAEFQTLLPLTRQKPFTAKILLALAIAATIWLPTLVILRSLWDSASELPNFSQFAINIASTGLVMFCVIWLFLATVKSFRIATFAGLITPLIVWSILWYIAYLVQDNNQHVYRWRSPDNVYQILEYSYRGLCLTTSPICFGIGTWLYLRRWSLYRL